MPAAATRAPAQTAALSNGDAAAVLAQFPFVFEIVPISKMFVDMDYQRELTTFVETITAEGKFNPALVMTLCLSLRRSGKYAVIDGQTRMVACERLGFEALPALVYTGLSKPDEARIFELLQTQRRNITSLTRFKAALAGGNRESRAIMRLVESLGLKIGTGPQEIRSVAALEYGYRIDDFTLERALVVLRDAFGPGSNSPNPKPPNSKWIRSTFLFLRRNPDIRDERLVQRLQTAGQQELQIRASHLMASGNKVEGSGSNAFLAQAIKNAYQA